MSTFKLLLGPMRVPFLILAPACVAVGVGTAYWQTHEISWSQVLLVLLGAPRESYLRQRTERVL